MFCRVFCCFILVVGGKFWLQALQVYVVGAWAEKQPQILQLCPPAEDSAQDDSALLMNFAGDKAVVNVGWSRN
jgi:hypothetical protein